ncbi:MAG: helix-turn-helix domain-containing protein [Pseudomonadota bacterium]
MHHARLASSPRLQRVLAILRDADGEVSSLEIAVQAQTVAASTCISELRANGCEISSRLETQPDGSRRWFYTLLKGPVK